MSMKKFEKNKKDYLKNATKIHSTICNLVECILFSRTSVYYDNINSLFSPPYLISYLTTIFLWYHFKVLGKPFCWYFLFLFKCAPFLKMRKWDAIVVLRSQPKIQDQAICENKSQLFCKKVHFRYLKQSFIASQKWAAWKCFAKNHRKAPLTESVLLNQITSLLSRVRVCPGDSFFARSPYLLETSEINKFSNFFREYRREH